MPLNIVFMGTPGFSVPTLKAIVEAGHKVVAVYSQPPRPAGRGMGQLKSPVQQAAEARSIPVLTPRSLKSPDEQAVFASLGGDVAVVVAYGLLLPAAILAAPRLGCLNGHASKLPRWRGAAPIQRAIMAGDTETAMMIMRMEEGLDTGPICLSEPVAISGGTTAGDLHDELMQRGAVLMVKALALLERGELPAIAQPHEGITYAAKISKAEAEIHFDRPAREVLSHIHGLSPFPGAWFEATPAGGKLERIKVLRARAVKGQGTPGEVLAGELTIACRDGALQLIEVQRAGKKPMAGADFSRGFALAPGTRIGTI
ncbi:MAG: methionyl-tRNA formyltransferase [Hyphomicrobium sp.]